MSPEVAQPRRMSLRTVTMTGYHFPLANLGVVVCKAKTSTTAYVALIAARITVSATRREPSTGTPRPAAALGCASLEPPWPPSPDLPQTDTSLFATTNRYSNAKIVQRPAQSSAHRTVAGGHARKSLLGWRFHCGCGDFPFLRRSSSISTCSSKVLSRLCA